MFTLFIYSFVSAYFVESVGLSPVVSNFYYFYAASSYNGWIIIVYLQEKSSKEYFQNQLKIRRLIKEQRNILETLPDGLIIH